MKKLLVHARSNRRSPGAQSARACVVLLACLGVALTLGVAGSSASSAPSLGAPRSYTTGRGPFLVAIRDMNGDEEPDLAVGNARAGNVSVLFNGSHGSFEPKRDYATGSGLFAIGDLNGDGKPDLAVARAPATVSVLVNRATAASSRSATTQLEARALLLRLRSAI